MRLIDADALFPPWGVVVATEQDSAPETVGKIMNAIRSAPTITAESLVKRGRWIKLAAHKGMENHKCSLCRSECYVPTCMGEPMYSFCPNCGAKMEEDA